MIIVFTDFESSFISFAILRWIFIKNTLRSSLIM